jgi:hypothetical protein
VRESFRSLILGRRYAANDPKRVFRTERKSIALTMKRIQWNQPTSVRWMIHDTDSA